MCSPGSCECGTMNSTVVVNPLTVCVLTYGLDEYPGPLSGPEGIIRSSEMHVCTHDCSPV